MTNVLDIRSLHKAYGPHQLFDAASLTIGDGERVGLVGANGAGKSTLLKILASLEEPDEIDLALRKGATVGYLHQDPQLDPNETPRDITARALSALESAISEYNQTTDQLASATDEERPALMALHEEQHRTVELLGGWDFTHRVESILERLGIGEHTDTPLGQLSGGQRRRAALAEVLLMRPDLLLLDEPTNHLDTETVEWLEETLINYGKSILLVTHDRYFLDRVVTRIVEIDNAELLSHPGNYEAYMARKIELARMRDKAEDRRLKLLENELAWLRRGAKARTSKARARKQQIGELQKEGKTTASETMSLAFSADRRLGGIILAARGVAKAYDDKQVLERVTLSVGRHEKIGILGPNGCGKTTLLRILVGDERPDEGTVERGKNTTIAWLSQTREGLDDDDTVLEALAEGDYVRVGERKVHKRTFLSEFLFSPDQQRKKVAALSGGERCRLLLAKLATENANVIVLDEPTNDLDIPSLQVLEDALAQFSGCVLLVTHDRYFLNRVCNVIAAFEDGDVVRYDGDYDFYRKRRQEQLRQQQRQARQARAAVEKVTEPQPARARRISWKEKQELAGIEDSILAVEDKKSHVEQRLADPALYQRSDAGTVVAELNQDLVRLTAEAERLYARWEELEALNQ